MSELRETLEREFEQCCCGGTHCCGTENAAVEGARIALERARGRIREKYPQSGPAYAAEITDLLAELGERT